MKDLIQHLYVGHQRADEQEQTEARSLRVACVCVLCVNKWSRVAGLGVASIAGLWV